MRCLFTDSLTGTRSQEADFLIFSTIGSALGAEINDVLHKKVYEGYEKIYDDNFFHSFIDGSLLLFRAIRTGNELDRFLSIASPSLCRGEEVVLAQVKELFTACLEDNSTQIVTLARECHNDALCLAVIFCASRGQRGLLEALLLNPQVAVMTKRIPHSNWVHPDVEAYMIDHTESLENVSTAIHDFCKGRAFDELLDPDVVQIFLSKLKINLIDSAFLDAALTGKCEKQYSSSLSPYAHELGILCAISRGHHEIAVMLLGQMPSYKEGVYRRSFLIDLMGWIFGYACHKKYFDICLLIKKVDTGEDSPRIMTQCMGRCLFSRVLDFQSFVVAYTQVLSLARPEELGLGLLASIVGKARYFETSQFISSLIEFSPVPPAKLTLYWNNELEEFAQAEPEELGLGLLAAIAAHRDFLIWHFFALSLIRCLKSSYLAILFRMKFLSVFLKGRSKTLD